MKIAFISGVKAGLDYLFTLLENNWDVSIVFSYDDSKRNAYSDYASFDEITKKHHIMHVKVKNINDGENVEILKKIKPDIIFVMGWSQLLKDEILKIPTLGVIGCHPTLLPKYRGRAPIPWSIIKGLKQSGMTFFYMDEGIDDGDILDQRSFDITNDDDASSLYEKATNIGKQLLLKNLPLLEEGKAKRIKQDESKFIEYWPKRTPEDGKINWNNTAKDIHVLIRATTFPYPGAFTNFKNSKLVIWKAEYMDTGMNNPGKILSVDDDGINVGTGKGIIIIKKISFGDKKETKLSDVFSKEDINSQLG